jgi:two-component system sensor histidine kinase UhpB
MPQPNQTSPSEIEAELQRLREENDLLKSLVRDAPVALVSLDLKRHVKIWNQAAERIFGWREDEVIGRPLPHIPEESVEQSQSLHNQVVSGESLNDIELERLTKDGKAVRVNFSTTPLRGLNNNVIGLVGVYEDFGDTLTHANSTPEIPFRGLVEQSLVGLYIIQDDLFQYVNPRFAAMFGYTQQEMAPQLVSKFIADQDAAKVNENLRKRIAGEITSLFYQFKGQHKDGRLVDIDVHGTRFQYRGQPAVIGVAIDVTEARQREEEIARSHERLRELSQHLLSMREEQRTKISRELHDELGGTLTALKMDLGWLTRHATEPKLVGRVQTMMDLIRNAIDTVRKISADLRPGVLDNLGLFDAIEWEAGRFRERLDIECNIAIQAVPIELDDTVATAIFRIFQETLTNISRHAQASRVDITVTHNDRVLTIDVCDNGQGIGKKELHHSKSYGLVGMAERALQIGATLDINSEAGKGTQVMLRYPTQASGEHA